jgi:hypothetical protein
LSELDLSLMGRLRQVLRLSSHGKGVAASVVETFRASDRKAERDMVRSILLGHPVRRSMRSLEADRKGSGAHSSDLMLYVVEQAKVDAAEASRRADKLTTLFEHWIWMTRQRAMEQKVMETRSIMVSAILGGVTAMVSSLAPVLTTFQISLGEPQAAPSASQYSPYLGMMFVIPAASFLGVFFSRRRAYLNVLAASVAYLVVTYFFGPLVLTI